MFLKDFLQQLAMGPVGDLSIGGEGSGTIPVGQVPRMVLHLNSALTDLHARMPLRKEVLSLATMSSRVVYPLQRQFAVTSGSQEADKFIIDAALKPFMGDVLGIESVHDHNHDRLNLNVLGDAYGWHTTKFDTLTMGYPVSGEVYFIQYRQRHPLIAANANQDTTLIEVPPSLEAALLAKAAQYVFGAMTSESAVLKANELMQAYEQHCTLNEVTNLANTSDTDLRCERFAREGWA